MTLLHHVIKGQGEPPIVFVHGFACSHRDWDAQVAHLSPRHRTVAVDLRGHGSSAGTAADCSIERYGADIAELLRALALPPSVLVGHSLGCRVVIEAALQAPSHTAGLVLVDGSQFSPSMPAMLAEQFAKEDGYRTLTGALFASMFTERSEKDVVASVVDRARRLPREVGEKMLPDLARYDVHRLAGSLGCLRVPVMAIQATYTNERRERASLRAGQSTPYLDLLRANVPGVRVEIVPDCGHFPQLDQSARTNAFIEKFAGAL
ncbi:MAG: alpha/beta fold hydrolase [Acetobacteraceae bacterium]